MKNVLVIVSIPHDGVAGSSVSACQIANSFVNDGYCVYIMVNKNLPVLTILNHRVIVIHDSYNSKIVGYGVRGNKINNTIKQYSIDLIVALDKVSCYHSSIPAALNKIPLIPIIPGGSKEAIKHPPLRTKKIIVFSDENKSVLINNWKFHSDSIIVKNSRFSFGDEQLKDYSIDEKIKIAFISGLRKEKLTAFNNFIIQLKEVSNPSYEVEIIGNGKDDHLFFDLVHNSKLSNISFIGYKQVTFSLLKNYHLVITQGRGVVESLSMGLPTAICGENGYKGLIDLKNLPKFKPTNFTGRNIDILGNLSNDIKLLKERKNSDGLNISNIIRKEYDVKHLKNEILNLSKTIDMVPSNGSLYRALYDNIKVLLKR